MENSFSSASSGIGSSSTLNEDLPNCRCGVRCKLQVSWTETNPGRRFLGCSYYWLVEEE
ncbi:hypothetical protein SESBI_38841 [Sesbania bispinosa]|nr:hypothetical protein SESBI_38841 [Sesbania bispinosa]